MSSIEFPPSIKIRLLKHNGKIRDLNTVENKEIAGKINAQIEIMIRTKAYNQVLTTLRARLTVKNSIYKKYAEELLREVEIYKDKTSLGDLCIKRVDSMSRSNDLVNEALEKLDLVDINDKIINLDEKRRYVIKMDTTGLKLIPEVVEQVDKLMKEFHRDTEGIIADNMINKMIANKISWIRRHQSYHSDYITAYNEVKRIFSKESTEGLFPRMYAYKGVVLSWVDIQSLGGLYNRVSNYLKESDVEMFDKFETMLMRIRIERKDHRIMMSLDGFDYTGNDNNEVDD